MNDPASVEPAIAAPFDDVPTDEHGRLIDDIPCLQCGYNLRGLDSRGVCPECGAAVGRSVHGNLLRFSDPKWVGKLALGMKFMLVGIVLGVVGGLVGGMLNSAGMMPEAAFWGVVLLMGVIMLIANYLVTEPEPVEAERSQGWTARRVARCALIGGWFIGAVEVGIGLVWNVHWLLDNLTLGDLLGFVGLIALLHYAANHLAPRVPDEKLARHTHIVKWGWGILLVLMIVAAVMTMVAPAPATSAAASPLLVAGCMFGALGFVFGIWGLVLIVQYYRRAEAAARDARATWARATEPGA